MDTLRACRARFSRPVFLWAVAALITQLAVEWYSREVLRQPATRLLILLPLIPAMFFMLALVRAIQKMDELQKRICLESVFVAFMVTLVLTFVFAGLESAGIYRVPVNDIGTLMMFLWACAYVFSAWRYR